MGRPRQRGGRFIDPPDADPSYKCPGGGLLSTSGDLVRLAGRLMDHTLLDSALVDLLWTPQLLPDGTPNPQNYGMGWRIDRAIGLLGQSDTLRVVHHGGASPGGSSFLLLVPDEHVAVAVMTNRGLRDAGPLRNSTYAIARAFILARRSALAH